LTIQLRSTRSVVVHTTGPGFALLFAGACGVGARRASGSRF